MSTKPLKAIWAVKYHFTFDKFPLLLFFSAVRTKIPRESIVPDLKRTIEGKESVEPYVQAADRGEDWARKSTEM